jgi:succinyl-CoA synthetase beta subunit
MKLFEYQAKEIFVKSGIPVPVSALVENAGELPEALNKAGLPCMLKAQVLKGGRGKAGLVKLVKTEDEADKTAREILASSHGVRKILVEQAMDVAKEIYLSVTMDPVTGKALVMGCAEGGVEIETVAAEAPWKIVREKVDLYKGLQPFQVNDFVHRLGLCADEFKKVCKIVNALYRVFVQYDAELAEINPLFVTTTGEVVAGDGKLSIDDNSMFRHTEYEKGREHYNSDMEYEAAQEGIPYLEFDGDISIMCAGAGLANTVYDLINYEGGTVANYLEFGGPNYMKSETAMRICLQNKPKVVLIVTFGTIARADVMAEGITKAIQKFKPECPIVVCLRGTGEEMVDGIFAQVGIKNLTDTEKAVKKAIAISRGGAEK